ncbi:MAG: HD domain-containing protein, partial [Caldilineae bacterium]
MDAMMRDQHVHPAPSLVDSGFPPLEEALPRALAAFQPLLDALLTERPAVHLVGGVVRDALLARPAPITDLDVALEPPVLPLARRIADRLGWAYFPLDAERDVARLVHRAPDGRELICDLAALRGSLAEDLLARDFTVNALAATLARDGRWSLVDVCDGVTDLAARRLRRVTEKSLVEDPIRLLRAVRLAGQLGFTIEEATAQQIRALAPTVAHTSTERVRDELWKLLAAPAPHESVEQARALGLLAEVLPEAADLDGVEQGPPHHLDVYRHTLLAVAHAAELRAWLKNADADLPAEVEALLEPRQAELRAHFAQELAHGHTRADWLVWHALFHDWGKPYTRSEEAAGDTRRIRFLGHETVSATLAARRLEALRFARREVQVAVRVAEAHMRPHQLSASFPHGSVSRRAAYRFFRAAAVGRPEDATGLDVLLLALADGLATGATRTLLWTQLVACVGDLLDFFFRRQLAAGPPLVDGRTLMAQLDLTPGPQVGRLLAAIAEAQAAGEIADQEQALALARSLLG